MIANPSLATTLAGALGACLLLAHAARAQDDDMVLVPAGPFTMGSSGAALDEDQAETPAHPVEVAAFRIDRTEVTNEQFARFLTETGSTSDVDGHPLLRVCPYLRIERADGVWRPLPGAERRPMVCVTWYGARAYAAWAGKRLPTEAEWEKAARGSDGRKFPWGPQLDLARLEFGFADLPPVGSFPEGASPYGCLDMAGSVWEWTDSLFLPYPYVAGDGREDPTTAGRRVARGGSWQGEPHIAHAAYRCRFDPDYAHCFLGFRCAASPTD